MSTLQISQAAPDFSALDENGQTVRLSDFKGKKNVVLYFYPKDDTPGCTIEACNFRDNYHRYEHQNTQILGVSFDDAASHRKFKEKFDLPFPLLIDSDHKIAEAYGVTGDKYPARDTIVIDKEGKVSKIFRQVNPKEHHGEVLASLG